MTHGWAVAPLVDHDALRLGYPVTGGQPARLGRPAAPPALSEEGRSGHPVTTRSSRTFLTPMPRHAASITASCSAQVWMWPVRVMVPSLAPTCTSLSSERSPYRKSHLNFPVEVHAHRQPCPVLTGLFK